MEQRAKSVIREIKIQKFKKSKTSNPSQHPPPKNPDHTINKQQNKHPHTNERKATVHPVPVQVSMKAQDPARVQLAEPKLKQRTPAAARTKLALTEL
ncbi:hypothetical protein PABG_12266 [Paracoccidioides brasiliensis Pb03]|uniref:Uncharacterized protein n=1 Tax=Paracoccidioides brasiliensis (strain Pb18) TaxID=502780 RepID=A0A0A0HWE1_PARBD|nr:uncharacterized protein PADG_12161 [Paracoccidioides brasiliensis Pb18]KGM91705.1 hypothetical protein PADG_12161 [Paracoccidioides brasiliensis Pb18]KGY14873.1 hypothetical protein PABG_12266 [Paracoccidioides brasiliensis Pb03]